jgi:hypothetical protein
MARSKILMELDKKNHCYHGVVNYTGIVLCRNRKWLRHLKCGLPYCCWVNEKRNQQECHFYAQNWLSFFWQVIKEVWHGYVR